MALPVSLAHGGGSKPVALLENVTRFLRTMSEEDIFSLLKTMTSGIITTDDPREAVKIIAQYSEPAALLNRKKVKVQYLIRFLHSENVPMKFPADKHTLITKLLDHWKVNRAEPQVWKPSVKTSSTPEWNNEKSTESSESPRAPFYPAYHEEFSKELGLKFSEWFYKMLNSLTDFEPKHFWPTCSLRVEAISGTTVIQEAINDGRACCNLLRMLVEVEKITFTPNLISGLGVSCVIDTYGLVKVKVAGTVQVSKPGMSLPGGIFEQVFGLMKDATAEDNYKVKFSILRLRAALNSLEYTQLSNAIMNTPVVIEEVDEAEAE